MVKLHTSDGSVLECSVEEYMQIAKAAGIETPILGENEIEVDGVIYEKVDDEAKKGDYIVYDEAPRSYLTSGKPYVVKFVDSTNDPHIVDDEYDDFDTYSEEPFTVYRKKEANNSVEVLSNENVEIGDKFIVLNNDTNNFLIGDLVTLTEKDPVETHPGFKRDYDRLNQVVSYKDVRRATQEEIEDKTPDDREQSFFKFGREVDEFKEGDIVEVLVSNANYSVWKKGEYARYVGNDGNNIHGRLTDRDPCNVGTEYLKLIAPIERLN